MIVFSIIQKSQLEGAKRLDAEYYQPEYLLLDKKVNSEESKTLNDLADNIICGPFGSAILNSDYRESGIPLIRVADLNDWFVKTDDLVFLDKKLGDKMSRYKVCDGDIVVSQRGTIAMFSKVTDDYNDWNISANLISIKNSNIIDFDYLLAFLNSKYGFFQLQRKLSGQVQPKITTDDIKEIVIFIPAPQEQKNVGVNIRQSFVDYKRSSELYKQAENIFLDEIGTISLQTNNFFTTVVNLSEVQTVNRFDAEYFNSPCNKMLAQISKGKTVRLGDLVEITKGVEPGAEAYQDNGKLFIRVSSISKDGIIGKDQKYLSDDLYNEYKNDYQPQVGDILLTKDASIGVACVVREPVEGIVSSGVMRLKLKEKMNPEYLALALNSIVGRLQAERDAGGSIISHWKPEQIKNLVVPILPTPTQQKIADLVIKSYKARKKAKELLEEAKLKVEEMIEKGGEKI